MDKAPAIIGVVLGLIIAILTLILLFTEYKDCFSKDFIVKNQARKIYRRQWIFTLVICIISIWMVLGMTSYLIFSNWDFHELNNLTN
ncbi:hypothetical protein [Metamycoplasma equirhinis]|uniref:hypothetical protein n=1 Tax=Metamycoplasma equirhinis TaxID=92402 RepID=UPI0035946C79